MSKRDNQYFVYILTNTFGVLYTGVTSDLTHRLDQHRHGEGGGFTNKYKIGRLVYWEVTPDVHSALAREKEIKSWRRSKKLELIRMTNPTFRDLSEEF